VKPRPPLPAGPFLIVGLARSGAAAALTLRARGEDVIGVDAGAALPGMDELATAGVQLHVADDGLSALERAGAVVKSPGVPAQAPAIAAARARGIPVLGELELAWRLLPNEFIAVTGTNGKTTTVELIGHIHREAGLPVVVAGNVGVALSGLVGRIEPQATIVCEASSFQLEDTLAFAPEAAVLLNFSADHLDRHGTLEDYLAAKLQVFARQGKDDLAVLPSTLCAGGAPLEGEAVAGRARRVCFGAVSGAEGAVPDAKGAVPDAELSQQEGRLWWQGQPLIATGEIGLRGEHNLQNAMAAAVVCLARGIDPDAVRAGLRGFAGVAHRLEEVARRDGVLYVNDSKATNLASTLVALRAFPAVGIHLILGGQGKGQDFTPLRAPVQESCRGVYLIGEDAPLLAEALEGIVAPVHRCGDLEQAIALAGELSRSGEVVLLSPACASFDQFADFEARGERFRELVDLSSR
jgi:UDP-N-acetylmuramoylalanine--D-glutamate ligase